MSLFSQNGNVRPTSDIACALKLVADGIGSCNVTYIGYVDRSGQIKRIVDSASEPQKMFYAILAETGIRGGEICALRVADLDLDNAVIYVRQSVWRGQIQTVKSKKGNRRFPISPQLVEHLREYLRGWKPNPPGLLFATQGGTPWDHSLVHKRKFHPLLRKLGIPQCGLHAFRHGNATLLDQIGAPMAVRQNRLGTPTRRRPWTTRTRLRQTSARLQWSLGKFSTLLHAVNKKKGQRLQR